MSSHSAILIKGLPDNILESFFHGQSQIKVENGEGDCTARQVAATATYSQD